MRKFINVRIYSTSIDFQKSAGLRLTNLKKYVTCMLSAAPFAFPTAANPAEASRVQSFPIESEHGNAAVLHHYRQQSTPYLDTSLGQGWRHSFDLLLTADEFNFTIFDESGTRHTFRRTADSSVFQFERSSDVVQESTLSFSNNQHQWSRADGSRVHFTGSLPTSISLTNGNSYELRYRNGLLVSVDQFFGNAELQRLFDFEYINGQLNYVRRAGSVWHRYTMGKEGQLNIDALPSVITSSNSISGSSLTDSDASQTLCVPDETEADACDTQASPAPSDFQTLSDIPNAIRIDIRPASCESYFTDYYGTQRGTQIEDALGNHPRYAELDHAVRSFPIVDFYEDGEIRVVRSRDLASTTLSSERGEPLYNRLIRDGADIQRRLFDVIAENGSITVQENGSTTSISGEEIEDVILEVVVRYDLATPAQIVQIENARQKLLEQFDVVLQIIEIP